VRRALAFQGTRGLARKSKVLAGRISNGQRTACSCTTNDLSNKSRFVNVSGTAAQPFTAVTPPAQAAAAIVRNSLLSPLPEMSPPSPALFSYHPHARLVAIAASFAVRRQIGLRPDQQH
jgi:hypothetical protein